jgi:hypothetical protein
MAPFLVYIVSLAAGTLLGYIFRKENKFYCMLFSVLLAVTLLCVDGYYYLVFEKALLAQAPASSALAVRMFARPNLLNPLLILIFFNIPSLLFRRQRQSQA